MSTFTHLDESQQKDHFELHQVTVSTSYLYWLYWLIPLSCVHPENCHDENSTSWARLWCHGAWDDNRLVWVAEAAMYACSACEVQEGVTMILVTQVYIIANYKQIVFFNILCLPQNRAWSTWAESILLWCEFCILHVIKIVICLETRMLITWKQAYVLILSKQTWNNAAFIVFNTLQEWLNARMQCLFTCLWQQ